MKNLPVNLLFPANYPEQPAIMLPEFISPGVALQALNRLAPAESSKESPNDAAESSKESPDSTEDSAS